MLDVSVILVNYKTKNLTKDAIDSLIAKTKTVSYEILVIDNNSNDGISELIANAYGDRVKLIESNVNIGFGPANNIAIKEAKGKYVFLLNPDTIVLNDVLSYFFLYCEKNKNIGC